MKELLEQTRQIARLVQQLSRRPEEFREMAQVLSRLIGANVYIVENHGLVLGYALTHGFECDILREEVIGPMRFPPGYVAGLARITETHPNLRQEGRNCVFKANERCLLAEKVTTLVPIKGGGERLGTLILARFAQQFEDRELILAEYAATVVGMEILRVKSERAEAEARKKATVQLALGTLSYSELEAMRHILGELEGEEGLLVASRIADRVGITRSVIVNALRKFESLASSVGTYTTAWIAEWQTGVEYYTGSGQFAGGPRMMFMATEQETGAPSRQGEFNLTAAGQQILRNMITYLAPDKPIMAGQ